MQRSEDREMAEFVRAYADFIERCLRRRGVADRDRPDLHQEALCIAARRLDQLSHPAQARAFLGTVCRRLARDLRRRACTRTESVGLDREPTAAPRQEGAIDAKRRLRVLMAALDDLPEAQRTALLQESMPTPRGDGQVRQAGRANKLFYRRLYAGRARLRAALVQRGLAVLLVGAAACRRALARYGAHWAMGGAACLAGLFMLVGETPVAPRLLSSEPSVAQPSRRVMFGVAGRARLPAPIAGAIQGAVPVASRGPRFSVQPVASTGARLALVRVGLAEVEVHVVGASAARVHGPGWAMKVTDPTGIKPPLVNRPR